MTDLSGTTGLPLFNSSGAVPAGLNRDLGAMLEVTGDFKANFSTDGFFQVTLPALEDGVHNLKLEVEDRAGNLSHDFLLPRSGSRDGRSLDVKEQRPAVWD